MRDMIRLFILPLILFFSTGFVWADVQIDIYRSRETLYKVAVLPFSDGAEDVSKEIGLDLRSSGIIHVPPVDTYVDLNRDPHHPPSFGLWNNQKVQFLVLGSARHGSASSQEIRIVVWDVLQRLKILDKHFSIQSSKDFMGMHRISNVVYRVIVGRRGFFDSRIVWVERRSGRERLHIVDQNGAHDRVLTDWHDALVEPKFSHDGKKITYVTADRGRSVPVILDLRTDKAWEPFQRSGLTFFSSTFGANDRELIYARTGHSGGSNADIYAFDLITGKERRLTHDANIDVSADASWDGTRIAFMSDRSGHSNIYIMDGDGGNKHRVTFGNGSFMTPAWSHDGKELVYLRVRGKLFSLEVLNLDNMQVHTLRSSWRMLSPRFSPMDRLLLFSSVESAKLCPGCLGLYRMSVFGGGALRLPLKGKGRAYITPATDWSPRLEASK